MADNENPEIGAEDSHAAAVSAARSAPSTNQQADDTAELGDAGKKALDAERSRAREAERKWKAAEKALDAERAKGLSDADKAIAQAKADGAAEATLNAGKRLARAEIRAAAAAAGLKVADDDLDDLDLSKFVGEDGEPDPTAIGARIKRWQALAPESPRPRGSIDQGNRGSSPTQSNADAFAEFLQNQMRATK